jgi:hypothetical protein
MLRWISTTYQMSPSALARMFQRSPRTVNAWLREGRVSPRNGSRIRSSFYYLNNLPDPRDPARSAIWMA